ncbi:MAG: hypothetical protein IKX85_05940 [Clostridia bacterium]|nr:hypothetical protein [Clostridia bacterium]
MLDNEKRFRPHTSHGFDVGVMLLVLHIATGVLTLAPYARYGAWLLPLVFLLLEKESDFARFSLAQLFSLSFLNALIALAVDVPVRMLLDAMNRSLSFGVALAGDFFGLLTSILSSLIGLFVLILALIVGVRAKNYIQTRIALAGAIGDRILAHLK